MALVNVGPIPVNREAGPWSMNESDTAPTGSDFERFIETLEAFIEGYFAATGVEETPIYCQGDFFGERTEAIWIRDDDYVPAEGLFAALKGWLNIPIRRNWRIIFPQLNDMVIYASEIVR